MKPWAEAPRVGVEARTDPGCINPTWRSGTNVAVCLAICCGLVEPTLIRFVWTGWFQKRIASRLAKHWCIESASSARIWRRQRVESIGCGAGCFATSGTHTPGNGRPKDQAGPTPRRCMTRSAALLANAFAAVRHNAKTDYGFAPSNSIRSSARTATVGDELKICDRGVRGRRYSLPA